MLLLGAFFVLFFLGGILTPFLISIIFAYLLVGMQTRLESFGISTIIAFLITYSFFLLLGAALIVWLGPLVYQQLQSIILEVPKWLNSFIVFAQDIPEKYPDLVSSDQITSFFIACSGRDGVRSGHRHYWTQPLQFYNRNLDATLRW